MTRHQPILLLSAATVLLTGCGDLHFTAPLLVTKTVYLALDQAAIDACGSVGFTSTGTAPFPYPTASTNAPEPYHLGLMADGGAVTPLEPNELLNQGSFSVRRAGTLVFRTYLVDRTVHAASVVCERTTQMGTVSFKAAPDLVSGNAPYVVRFSRTTTGTWSAAVKEYPAGTPETQLNLP